MMNTSPKKSDPEEAVAHPLLTDPDWTMRKVSQAGFTCCMLLTAAMALRCPREMPFQLPAFAAWAAIAIGLLLLLPVWRYLEHSQPRMNLIVSGLVLACLINQTYGRRTDAGPDPQVDAIVADHCPELQEQREDRQRVLEELLADGKTAQPPQITLKVMEWTLQATRPIGTLAPWGKKASNPFRPGWLTAEPLTTARVRHLHDELEQMSRGYKRVLDAYDANESQQQADLLGMGLSSEQARIVINSLEITCRMRQLLRLRQVWTQRMHSVLDFMSGNLDAFRITPDRKGLEFTRRGVEAPFRQRMTLANHVLEVEERLLRDSAAEAKAAEAH